MEPTISVPTISVTDCREPNGIVVGLIDALISICRVLAQQDLSDFAVTEALKDLRSDEDCLKIFSSNTQES